MNGSFAVEGGTLVVSGFETRDEQAVDRLQFYEFYDASNNLVWERVLPMRFALIGRERFVGLADVVGFRPVRMYGDYEYGEYLEGRSESMIWVLEK